MGSGRGLSLPLVKKSIDSEYSSCYRMVVYVGGVGMRGVGDSLLGTWIWRRDKFGSNEAVSGVLLQDALGHIEKSPYGSFPK